MEFPLWTAELETEQVAVVIAHRTTSGVAAYLYDIKTI